MIIYLSFIIYVKVYHEEDRKYLKDQRNKVCCGSYGLGSAVRNGERRPCNQQPDVIEVQEPDTSGSGEGPVVDVESNHDESRNTSNNSEQVIKILI